MIVDRKRFHEHRGAAVLTVGLGSDDGKDGLHDGVGIHASRKATIPVTIASLHLDVWAEMKGHFGVAEGELARLLEYEAIHHEISKLPNLLVAGDFNAASRLCANASTLHRRIADVADELNLFRDAAAWRHVLPRSSPRLPEDWALTALGFAEQRLGYVHAWQQPLDGGPSVLQPPLYSHWSGQLIDHCLLLRPSADLPADLAVTCVATYHTDASDHLPLIVDLCTRRA